MVELWLGLGIVRRSQWATSVLFFMLEAGAGKFIFCGEDGLCRRTDILGGIFLCRPTDDFYSQFYI